MSAGGSLPPWSPHAPRRRGSASGARAVHAPPLGTVAPPPHRAAAIDDRARPRRRHDGSAGSRRRRRRRGVRPRLPSARPAVPETGMGRARPRGDLAARRRGPGRGRGPPRRARRAGGGPRRHQPARDRHCMGQADGTSPPRRHRLAGPPDRTPVRGAQRRRDAPARAFPHRSRPRPVLLGDEVRMASHRGRRATRSGPRARNDGRVAPVAPEWRRPLRDRRHERLAHHALRHRIAPLDIGALRDVRRPRRSASRGAPFLRAIRSRRWRAGGRRGRARRRAGERCRRRSAGRALRSGLHPPGAGQGHLRDGDDAHGDQKAVDGASEPCAIAYALEGSDFVSGAAIDWMRDGLGLVSSPGELAALASSVNDSGGLVAVPAFAGLGSPWWDPRARGTVTGITRGAGRAELARALVEAIAFSVRDILAAMTAATGDACSELRVDGGVSAMDLLLQLQADQLQVPVVRPRCTESTAFGAAMLAGLAEGVWRSPSEVASLWREDARKEPAVDALWTDLAHDRWSRAVEWARGWERR